MSTTEDLALSSAISVAKLTCVTSVGVLAAIFPRGQPILHKGCLADLSRLLVNIVWPAWAFCTVGAGIKRDDLLSTLPLLPWCAFAVGLSLLLGFISARACHIDDELRPAYIVACGFCNSVAVPIMLLSALCEQPALSHIENCERSATGCIQIYGIVWNFVLFTVGVPMLEGKTVAAESQVLSKQEVLHGTTMHGTKNSPVQNSGADEEKALDVSDVKIETQVNILDEAGSAKLPEPQRRRHCCCCCSKRRATRLSWQKRALLAMWRTIKMPPMIAIWLGLIAILIPPIQDAFFDHSGSLRFAGSAMETVAAPGIAGFTFVMAASLVPSDKLRKEFSWTSWPMSPKTLIAFIVTRLILIPTIFYSVWYAVERVLYERVFGTSSATPPLVALVALIEAAAPAASMPIVFLAKMNKHDLATRLAFSYMFMYPVAIVTLTFFSTVALKFVVQ